MGDGGTCPDDNSLSGFAQGLLDEAAVVELDRHLDACANCARALAELARAYGVEARTAPGLAATLAVDADPDEAIVLQRGESIGRYVVLELLGMGGMGVVYAAWDPELDRKVALKLLRRDGQALVSLEAAERLLREARAIARLSHPNVVAIHDVGTWEGTVFLAMEFVDGGTLGEWLEERPRSVAETLEIFAAAGRGLSAAHEAGLIHRDIKPDNVMIDRAGRVRVMDFSVAATPGVASRPSGLEAAPVDALTRTGTILGTPVYMSPEQLTGRPTDARSDQFSYCVTLYEALFGARPFRADDFGELCQAVTRGLAGPLPKRRGLGPRVKRAIARGLAVDPARRYASMKELVGELTGQRQKRGWAWAARLALACLTLAGVLGVWELHQSRALLCSGGKAKMARIWDSALKEKMHAAFSATGLTFADLAWRRTEQSTDRYARAWEDMYKEACEATRVRGEQSDLVLSLRMQCLDQRIDELAATTELFTHADAEIVERAATLTDTLGAIDRCKDPQDLNGVARPPDDPGLRASVGTLRAQLAKAQVLLEAGKYAAGRTLATGLAKQALALPYRPVQAEALYLRGALEARSGDEHAAEDTLYAAMSAAEAARHDQLAAQIWVTLFGVESSLHDADARHGEALALAAIDRLGERGLLRAELLGKLGVLRQDQGQIAEAVAKHDEAIAILERLPGDQRRAMAEALCNRASARVRANRVDEGLDDYRRCLELRERTLDPDHPLIAAVIDAIAIVRADLGQHEQARKMYLRALAIQERGLGPEHPDVAETLSNLTLTLIDEGKAKEALQLQQRALQINLKAYGHDHPYVAFAYNNLGLVWRALGDNTRRRESYAEALAIREKVYGPDHISVANALRNVAAAALDQDKPAEALVLYQRALHIDEKVLGPDHPDLSLILIGIGTAYRDLHDYAAALPSLERALKLRETTKLAPDYLALARFKLAQTLWDLGRDRDKARTLATEARDGYVALGMSSHAVDVANVQAWLRDHR
jgi:tetratricopeptide (TPR) repeat protein